MRKLVMCLVLCFVWLGSTVVVYADNKCKDDPRECFDGFEDDDTIKTKSGKAERTFAFPPIKAGFVIDFYNRDILPHISLELQEFTVPFAGDFSLDVGVAASRVFITLSWEFIPLIKAGPTVWGGYNVREEEAAFGVGVSILNF